MSGKIIVIVFLSIYCYKLYAFLSTSYTALPSDLRNTLQDVIPRRINFYHHLNKAHTNKNRKAQKYFGVYFMTLLYGGGIILFLKHTLALPESKMNIFLLNIVLICMVFLFILQLIYDFLALNLYRSYHLNTFESNVKQFIIKKGILSFISLVVLIPLFTNIIIHIMR